VTGQLDAERIRAPIAGLPRGQLDSLEVFAEIESTNSYLLAQSAPLPGRFRVALADHQTAGRGRMERQWQSPGSSGICLSMAYTFAAEQESLPCVTLAIGIGAVLALEKIGVRGIGLKWPNDLVIRDGKLGGILTEVRSTSGNAVTIVSGIGINYDLREHSQAEKISTRLGHASDLASAMRELPSRSTIATALIEGLFNTLVEFETVGFGKFAEIWERYDWLRGQRINIDLADRRVTGTCQGIEASGALILRTKNGRELITSGSVSFSGQNVGQPGSNP
jgi:BirA family biotin operon repressor/biotin-[acetyl-CoA-carboxylase] ligase